MERFEFDHTALFGPNTNRLTRHGSVEIHPWSGSRVTEQFCSLEIHGPAGASRGEAVMDKATAGKLGAALLKWAGNSVVISKSTAARALLAVHGNRVQPPTDPEVMAPWLEAEEELKAALDENE